MSKHRRALILQISRRYIPHLRFYDSISCSQKERSILIVGDGDLSYSASIALSNNGSQQLVATVLESETEHRSIYENSTHNIKTIRECGHQVRFQVDARCLSHVFDTKFDRIQWNFPHYSGRTNARKNRELIRQFFLSSKEVLNPICGKIHMALFEHQGGAYSMSLDFWRQSWMPARYAAETAGLLLHDVSHFRPEYKISSYQSKDKPFYTKRLRQMYIFSVADGNSAAPKDLQLFSSFTVYIDPAKCNLSDFLQEFIPSGIRIETSLQSIEFHKESFVTFPLSKLYTAKHNVLLFGEKIPMTQQLAESLRINIGKWLLDKGRVSSWNASHVKPSFLRQFEFL